MKQKKTFMLGFIMKNCEPIAILISHKIKNNNKNRQDRNQGKKTNNLQINFIMNLKKFQ